MELQKNSNQLRINIGKAIECVKAECENIMLPETPIELSQTSELASEIKNLVVNSQPSCSAPIEISSESHSETSSEQSSTTATSSSSSENVEIIKNKRKRKRKRKKKQPKAAETIPVPFTARYKKYKKTIIPTPAPKVHIRFDDTGNLDEENSEFNRKPRIIRILATNLLLNESLKQQTIIVKPDPETPIEESSVQEIVASISLKPRIIKAIII
ncbi:unnamed protein product [Diamesa serratosioi]